jgi:putative transposase
MDILALLQCLAPLLSATTLRQLSRIIFALLAMTGRVTMLGLSRWAGTGGSYRTLQRWFDTTIPWLPVLVCFFRQRLFRPGETYILAGDEVVVTKAGKQTFGLDRFFSSIFQKPVPGLAFFGLSLVNTTERCAFPVAIEQVVRTPEEKAARHAQKQAKAKGGTKPKRKLGRPRGSQNKKSVAVTLTPELQHIQAMLQALLKLLSGWLSVTYVALDGHFGNHHAWHMVQQCHLHLISKLRSDSALYLPYAGPPPKRGPHRKYGTKLDYRNLPAALLQQTSVKDGMETRVYQAHLLHTEFSQPLNVVILVKTNLQTQQGAHVILFSSDLTLEWARLIDYYSLRFQIEFNFRDAKQYWGLEDFMNITQTAVTNAASLSWFMVNVSYCVRRNLHPQDAAFSVLDLKATFRGYKDLTETIKMLPQKPDANLVSDLFRRIATLGSIHPTAGATVTS